MLRVISRRAACLHDSRHVSQSHCFTLNSGRHSTEAVKSRQSLGTCVDVEHCVNCSFTQLVRQECKFYFRAPDYLFLLVFPVFPREFKPTQNVEALSCMPFV